MPSLSRGHLRIVLFASLVFRNSLYYIPIPLGWRVKREGKVSISVMFEYGRPGYEFRIVDSFSLYSRYIVQVVETLETFVEA